MKTAKNIRLFMNPETGSVDTYDNWFSDSKAWGLDVEEALRQLRSLIEVKLINGQWVEVE